MILKDFSLRIVTLKPSHGYNNQINIALSSIRVIHMQLLILKNFFSRIPAHNQHNYGKAQQTTSSFPTWLGNKAHKCTQESYEHS